MKTSIYSDLKSILFLSVRIAKLVITMLYGPLFHTCYLLNSSLTRRWLKNESVCYSRKHDPTIHLGRFFARREGGGGPPCVCYVVIWNKFCVYLFFIVAPLEFKTCYCLAHSQSDFYSKAKLTGILIQVSKCKTAQYIFENIVTVGIFKRKR